MDNSDHQSTKELQVNPKPPYPRGRLEKKKGVGRWGGVGGGRSNYKNKFEVKRSKQIFLIIQQPNLSPKILRSTMNPKQTS